METKLLIDLLSMKGIQVDPAARTAWAQPGLLWQEFDHETRLNQNIAPRAG